MKMRLSPSFVVAVAALVLASGGTGYAAAKITSKQIKDGTIQSRDVKDGALSGLDLADGSVSTADLLDATITGTDVADGSLSGADLGDGSVSGADVADGSLGGADVADGSLSGADLADATVGRAELDRACARGESAVFGGCVRRVAYARSSYLAAVDDCNRRGGRLPTTQELNWIANHDEFGWADGNENNYEFSGSFTSEVPFTPMGFDRNFNPVYNSSAQLFWHHCITY